MRRASATVNWVAMLAVPEPAGAHGLAARADLPNPAWAAAAVPVVSSVGLAVLWRTAALEHGDRFRPLPARLVDACEHRYARAWTARGRMGR